MSEFINNREHNIDMKNFRKEKLKELIIKLHDGKAFEEVKSEFEKDFGSVSAHEITQLEQALIEQGMPVAEVQRLCDVHSAVFKGSIEEIHGITPIRATIGHPVNTMLRENQALKNFLSVKFPFHLDLLKEDDNEKNRLKIKNDLQYINQLDRHYLRKENLLFPYLEKYGIYGPAKVMWGKDDEVRYYLKEVISDIDTLELNELLAKINRLVGSINEMIFKEEEILLPMALDNLTQDEWVKIQTESDEFGYAFIDKPDTWIPKKIIEDKTINAETLPDDGLIRFETGIISVKQLEWMLNTLPVDITFIDENDVVRYFSHGKERIFPRTKSVIGRTVQNCHPPKSVHIVEKILTDFKNGRKDYEDFWIQMHGMFVYIRYFAVRDGLGNYLGTLEFTQNIKPIRELEDEKRLLED